MRAGPAKGGSLGVPGYVYTQCRDRGHSPLVHEETPSSLDVAEMCIH